MAIGMTEMAQRARGTPAPHQRRSGKLISFAVKLALTGGVLLLCWRLAAARFTDFDSGLFWDHLSGIQTGVAALALAAATVSYAAISCYDLIAFRTLGATAPTGKILRTGAAATALGQLLGFGMVIGAFVRWRLLRDEGVTQTKAACASAIVALGFLGGLVVLGGLATTLWPHAIATMTNASEAYVRITGPCILLVFALLLFAGHRRASVRFLGCQMNAPRPTMAFLQVTLAAIDVLFAATVLWLLTPDAAQVSFGTFFLAYIGVLAICLLANTPGGVGPLEGALLFALPDVPVEALLAGIFAFRAVYYIMPGLLGLLALISCETGRRSASVRGRHTPKSKPRTANITLDDPAFRRALAHSGRAEDELAHLGDKCLLSSPTASAFLMYRQYGRALIAIGDPVGDPLEASALCENFLARAAQRRLTPVFYKVGPALADAARRSGLHVAKAGHEAVIDLACFTIADRDRREIRRKVRKAAKAGVTIIAHAPGVAPLATFAPLCAEWQAARRAPEAAFSMGVCDAKYLSRFPIYEARIQGTPVAFISLWRSGDGREWAVDVMRHTSDAPQGVMQALIVVACDGARAAGATKFNLCLAPLSGLCAPDGLTERIGEWVFRRGERLHRLQGLHRFKASFRPKWAPRYVARAKGLGGLYGLWAVHRLINRAERPAHPLDHASIQISAALVPEDPHIAPRTDTASAQKRKDEGLLDASKSGIQPQNARNLRRRHAARH